MISVEDQKTFELYYQTRYDFNTGTLKPDDIYKIKDIVREKRVDYALAPIGDNIFEYIKDREPNISFEVVYLDTEDVDGMLYIPKNGADKAYIILNGNKPFINQIFAATHEYYHYICDYEQIKNKPYVCCLSSLEGINEKKASRFAAEFLLPEQALKKEVTMLEKTLQISSRNFGFDDYASLSILLTVKYQLPLKAVIYRLHEEGYIKRISKFIEGYEFIKNVLLQVDFFQKDVKYLYSKSNEKLDNEILLFQQMKRAFDAGLVTRNRILEDAEELQLNNDIIDSIIGKITDEEDEEDEEDELETTQKMKDKWGGLFYDNSTK